MPVAHLNGTDIYYEDHGSGMPVILTHGWGASSRGWQGQVVPISERYRLITWDMRGHGGTAGPDDPAAFSEAATVEDIRALLELIGAERAVVGGLSLGGYMSMAFHLAHPEMVRALVLCDTGPGYRNDAARGGWNQTAERRAQAIEERGLDALGRGAEVEAARSGHRSVAGLVHATRGMLSQRDGRVIGSLESIKVPTLLIVGENDAPYLNATDYMEKKIPGARMVVIKNAGHSSNIDQPQAFNTALLGFLDGLGVG